MGEAKILITGTGRTGTTVLVRLFTELGLDTGECFGKLTPIDRRTHAGLEYWTPDDPDAPRVIKDTTLCMRLRSMLEQDTVRVEHVIVPIRDLGLVTASRVRASEYGRNRLARGGLLGTMRPWWQRQALAFMFYELMSTLAEYEVPHTLLSFPRFTTDPSYTYDSLAFLTPDSSPDDYRRALATIVRTDLVHQLPLSTHEQWKLLHHSLRLRFDRGPLSRIPNFWEQRD